MVNKDGNFDRIYKDNRVYETGIKQRFENILNYQLTDKDEALPLFIMKFACFSDISAPPIFLPLSPHLSISSPELASLGFLNIDPKVGPDGCTAFLEFNKSLYTFLKYSSVIFFENENVAPRITYPLGMDECLYEKSISSFFSTQIQP